MGPWMEGSAKAATQAASKPAKIRITVGKDTTYVVDAPLNPDGTALSGFYGNRVISPGTFMHARAIPGTHAVLSEMWNGFPDTLETVVPRTEAFARASTLGIPVGFLGDGAGAPEARRFELLADEVEARMNRLHGIERVHEAQPARQLL